MPCSSLCQNFGKFIGNHAVFCGMSAGHFAGKWAGKAVDTAISNSGAHNDPTADYADTIGENVGSFLGGAVGYCVAHFVIQPLIKRCCSIPNSSDAASTKTSSDESGEQVSLREKSSDATV